MGSHVVYQWCLYIRDREKEIAIETADGQMNRTRERGETVELLSENSKTFLNVILHHVRDDSGFSRTNVGRYSIYSKTRLSRQHVTCQSVQVDGETKVPICS